LRAEQELPVPPLTLPDAAAAGAAAIAEAEAVRLFVQRARAGRPDFALTDENARDVAAVCRRLDGLPLALELAAARARLLSPRALLARLEHRFDLLRSDARDAEPRHRTLRDVIDWSYALLAPDEQATFDALSVFVGGFTLDAAAAVAAAGSGAPDVLDRVASLCDKSLLVRREDADGEPRLDMLETVRAYGLARLRDTPRDAAVRARHARWMAEVADVLSDEVGSPARARALARVHPDMDNALAALAWSTGPGGDPVDALRVAGGLTMFWHWLGLWEQGRGWAEAAVRAADAAATARGEPDDAARPLTERVGLGKALQAVALLGWMLGDAPGALAHAGRALRVWQSVEGDAVADARTRARAAELQTYACSVTAFAHLALGEPVEADRSAAAGVAAADRSGGAWARGFALGWRSMLTTALGRPDEAAADLARAERELRSIGDSWALAWCYTNASAAALAQGDAALAAQHARDAVAALHREPDWQYVARGLDALAAAMAAWLEGAGDGRGRASPECHTVASTAAKLLGAATGVRERSGTTGWEYDRRMHDATAARLRTSLGPAAFDASWAGGRTLPADEVFALAARADLTPATRPGRPLGPAGVREATRA
jgi:predicted ATPase